jgi:hypothetical protein
MIRLRQGSGATGTRVTPGVLVALALLWAPRAAAAQEADVTTEVDVTVGRSTEDVRAAGSQVRVFGALVRDWRFYAEASWADTWGEHSDAFGSAYPYNHRVRPMELYVEKTAITPRAMWGLKTGRYRAPFGLYGRSDHAYTGFLRAPLIRYGGYWALSNNFLETGASVVAGTPRVFGEISLGIPQDEDDLHRARGFDRVGRVQASVGDVIVGASYIHTQPFKEQFWAQGDTEFAGIDARWMRGGVQLRGEWINGHPFAGTRTFGGYADLMVHRQFMGPVTAVLRAERLDYEAGRFSSFPRRYTAGAKVRLSSLLVAHVNVLHEPPYDDEGAETALDVALTFSLRH